MQKTLVLEDEATLVTKIVHTSVIIQQGMINLMQALNDVLSDVTSKTIRCYDFLQNTYTEINSQDCLVPLQFMIHNPSSIILLKISQKKQEISFKSTSSLYSLDNEVKSENSSVKKERSKERVIFEVIEIVKRWRELHYAKNNCKKKSLQEAATMVGLPKKSLDDYYYQLRLGQKYDFDFKTHLFDRIGVLRTYLKDIKQSPLYDKKQKHPKRLKILDSFEAMNENYKAYNRSIKMKQQNEQYQFEAQSLVVERAVEVEQQDQNKIYEQSISQQENKQVQDHFFNQFQYLMNEKDPFLACDYDFKKKNNNGYDDFFQF